MIGASFAPPPPSSTKRRRLRKGKHQKRRRRERGGHVCHDFLFCSLLSFVLSLVLLFVCLFEERSLLWRSFPPLRVIFSEEESNEKKKLTRVMHFFSSFSVFLTTCCVFGVSFIHPFPKRHCCSTLNTHTHLIHIYNNEKYGIVSCEYGIVFSRLRGERREKTFASLFSLSLSIRFFFSSRVFDDEM